MKTECIEALINENREIEFAFIKEAIILSPIAMTIERNIFQYANFIKNLLMSRTLMNYLNLKLENIH